MPIKQISEQTDSSPKVVNSFGWPVQPSPTSSKATMTISKYTPSTFAARTASQLPLLVHSKFPQSPFSSVLSQPKPQPTSGTTPPPDTSFSPTVSIVMAISLPSKNRMRLGRIAEIVRLYMIQPMSDTGIPGSVQRSRRCSVSSFSIIQTGDGSWETSSTAR